MLHFPYPVCDLGCAKVEKISRCLSGNIEQALEYTNLDFRDHVWPGDINLEVSYIELLFGEWCYMTSMLYMQQDREF